MGFKIWQWENIDNDWPNQGHHQASEWRSKHPGGRWCRSRSERSIYVTHTWSIRPLCHFYSSSSPHLLNIYVGHRAVEVLLNIYGSIKGEQYWRRVPLTNSNSQPNPPCRADKKWKYESMQNKNTENANTNTNAEMLVRKTTQIIVMLIYLEHTCLLECIADIRYQVQLACTLYTTQPATEKAETFLSSGAW